MTSPDVSPGRFVLFAASIIGWIVWLSYALKFLFGAGMSGGWLAVGILVSLMALGLILMLKDLLSAVEEIRPQEWQSTRPRAKTARGGNPKARTKVLAHEAPDRRADKQEYHTALGLAPTHSAANRRRSRPFYAGRSNRRPCAMISRAPVLHDGP